MLTETIGDGYKKDADELKKLLQFEDDSKVLDRIAAIKHEKKQELAAYLQEKTKVLP